MIIEIATQEYKKSQDIILTKILIKKLMNIKEQTKYFLLSNELIRNKFKTLTN